MTNSRCCDLLSKQPMCSLWLHTEWNGKKIKKKTKKLFCTNTRVCTRVYHDEKGLTSLATSVCAWASKINCYSRSNVWSKNLYTFVTSAQNTLPTSFLHQTEISIDNKKKESNLCQFFVRGEKWYCHTYFCMRWEQQLVNNNQYYCLTYAFSHILFFFSAIEIEIVKKERRKKIERKKVSIEMNDVNPYFVIFMHEKLMCHVGNEHDSSSVGRIGNTHIVLWLRRITNAHMPYDMCHNSTWIVCQHVRKEKVRWNWSKSSRRSQIELCGREGAFV